MIGVLAAGCLVPPTAPRRDAATDARSDASAPPLSVLSVEVLDARGRTWPASGAPRTPTIVVTFSDSILSADGCYLLDGSAASDVVDDLRALPIRDATAARSVAVRTTLDDRRLTVTPEAQLPGGGTFSLAIAAWVTRRDGGRIETPRIEEIVIATEGRAGARVTDTWPPDGAFAVPPALALAALRFDGDVETIRDALALRGPDGRAVEGRSEQVPCPVVGWPSGACASFRPARALEPLRAYALAVRPGTLDATGALVPESTARFTTGDGTPPPLHANPTVCRSDEVPVGDACVRADDESLSLRLTLSGAARFAWSLGSRVGSSVAPRGEIAIGLDGLLPATPFTIAAGAADYAGQETVFTFTTATTEPLPTLSITEVRADPAGAEPRQEYVEIENYGPRPIVLAGLRLSDSDGEGDALPAAEIAAGGRFLVVTDDFDPEDGSGGDATVPRGTVLVRVDHTLCAGGLSNSGEPVYLRDASHRRISAAPATPPPLQGVCIVRTAASMRSGDAGTFEYDPSRTCTPGR